jgi:hypothetical protein
VNAAEVAAIGEAEDALIQLEGYIHVDTVFILVGTLEQFFAIRKP